MIQLNNICKTYKSKKGTNTTALKNINLKFDSKGLTFILGKSGSGKSTLLNIIGGIDSYDSGELIVLDKSTKKFKFKDYDNYRNRYVGFIFQDFNLIEDYTVYENIFLSLNLQNKMVDNDKLNNLLSRLEIYNLKNRKVNELSGGQKQRVAIARALIKKPKMILADEPTGNLDSKTGIEVMNLLKDISKDTLVIIVSHNEEYADKYADRVIKISDGCIVNDSNSTVINDSDEKYDKINTKLPLKNALNLGKNFLKSKKLKLFFTIFLISLATLFLSVSYIVQTYDFDDNYYNVLKRAKVDNVEIKKSKIINDQKNYVNLNNKDIELIEKKLKTNYNVSYTLNEQGNVVDILGLNVYQQNDFFNDPEEEEKDLYTMFASKLKIVPINSNKEIGNYNIIGKYPVNNDEIIISNYIADLILSNGIYEYNTKNVLQPNSYDELININKYIKFGEYNKVKIVGIVDYDLTKYKKLRGLYHKKNIDKVTQADLKLNAELGMYVDNLYNRVYVNSNFLNNISIGTYKSNLIETNIYRARTDNIKLSDNKINTINSEVEYYDGNSWKKTNKLEQNQMLINVYDALFTNSELYYKYIDKLNEYILNNPLKNELELEKEFLLKNIDVTTLINKKISLKIYEDTDYVIEGNSIPTKQYDDVEIIGICGLVNSQVTDSLFSASLLGKYSNHYIEPDSIIVTELNDNNLKELFNDFSYNNKYSIYGLYISDIYVYNNFISLIRPYINILTLVFFIFSSILICNFMFNSISSKKKEIGILKSLGAKNNDIIKIFIVEDFLLTMLSSIFSIMLLIVVFEFSNKTFLYMNSNYIVSPFYIDFKLVIVIFMYILFTIIVSSLFPIIKISKMKPIDAILNK